MGNGFHKRDYYEVLGVERTDAHKTIQSAFRKLARQFHPDKNGGKSKAEIAAAEEKFKEIGEAWEVLGDAAKRKRYDSYGHSAFGTSAASAGRAGGKEWWEDFEKRGGRAGKGKAPPFAFPKVEVGAFFAVVGTWFISHANKNIRHKKQEGQEVKWTDWAYMGAAGALTVGGVLYAAYAFRKNPQQYFM